MRAWLAAAALVLAATAAHAYDPLALPQSPLAPPLEVVLHDAQRNRDVPVRIFMPNAKAPQPVVLFSHGLGGSREGNAFMGAHSARCPSRGR